MPLRISDTEGGRLAPSFLLRFSAVLLASLGAWWGLFTVLKTTLALPPERVGIITLIVVLILMTPSLLFLFMRGDPQPRTRASDHVKMRSVLITVAMWAGCLIGYYFLVTSQGLNVGLSATLLLLVAAAGAYILMILPWELTLYLFFGVLTTLVSFTSFIIADRLLNGPIDLRPTEPETLWQQISWFPPQAISFTCAMLFAYPTNRKYVFQSNGPILKEFTQFITSRLLMTLIFEVGAFALLHNVFTIHVDLTKILTAFLVTAANYIVSKLYIFTRQDTEPLTEDPDRILPTDPPKHP